MEQRFEAEALPYLNDIFRTACRLVSDRQQAEDVTQEVFLQAWKSFDHYQSGTNCRAWLYKILFHSVSHHRRKWYRFPLLSDKQEFLESNLVQQPAVPQSLTDEEILAALDRIPDAYRAVILLVDVEDFAYKEASGILAVPIGTVMSRLNRARKRLRQELAGVAANYGIRQVNGLQQSRKRR